MNKEELRGRNAKWLDEEITVCDKCFMASCWQGKFMCDESQNAGTVRKTRRFLANLDLEHVCYLLTDEQIADM